MIRVITLGFFLFVAINAIAQSFTKVVPTNSTGLHYSHNAWFDFDNDGDLDFLITGAVSTNDLRTILYENKGNDLFEPAASSFDNLPQYSECEIAFFNTNDDDRIDVLLMGRRTGLVDRISMIENQPNGMVDLGPLSDFGNADGYGTLSTGDLNNDGTIDIFISGITGFTNGEADLNALLYLKNGTQFIKTTTSGFTGVYIASSMLADLDNDQDLDLILAGSVATYPYQRTLIYINDGTGVFTEISTSMIQVQNPSMDVADYDGDHDLDILLTGMDENLNTVTKLYANNDLTFSEIFLPSSLDRTASGSAKWGDYDNDGDFDILITGQSGTPTFNLAVFRNDGSNVFTELADNAFEPLGIGYASWGDYDGDHDLDILVTGLADASLDQSVLYILRNESNTNNSNPAIPNELKISYTENNACTLSWQASSDDITPQESLTYNLCVKDENTQRFVLVPFSDDVSGLRKINAAGNVWLNTEWKLMNLPSGTYSVKVQSIDGSFQGSSWSNESSIYSGLPDAPLDLQLSLQRDGLNIKWSDHSLNEAHFMIERNINNAGFQVLDSVDANVTEYTDPYPELPDDAMVAYRIYANNPHGRSDYSNIESSMVLSTSLSAEALSLAYPIPATDHLTIHFENPQLKGHVNIVSSAGIIISTSKVAFVDPHTATIDLEGISPGWYIAQIRGSSQSKTIKFLKK